MEQKTVRKKENQETIRKNRSATYMIPLLTKDINIDLDYLLINTFLKFNKYIEIPYPIGLLYEIEDTDAFKEYDSYLTHNKLFYKSFVTNDYNKLFVFNFTDKYINEYILFKEGRYSKFSVEAKSLIISYSASTYKYPPLIEDITGVLWKHSIRRERMERELDMRLPVDSELASIINYESETFNF